MPERTAGTHTPRSKLELWNLAKKILIDHGLFSVPVNPVVVANKLGIHVAHAVFTEPQLSGLTAKRENGVTILVRHDESALRKRFTVAHEIGHFLLHLGDEPVEIIDRDIDLFRTSESAETEWTKERTMEFEANTFAAELLMPGELVRQYWSTLPRLERTLSRMASTFQVSGAAMGFRLGDLGITSHD